MAVNMHNEDLENKTIAVESSIVEDNYEMYDDPMICEMEDYFDYIEKLSRDKLVALLKWEIQNRMFLMENITLLENALAELLCEDNDDEL